MKEIGSEDPMSTYVLKHIQGTNNYLGPNGDIVQGIDNAHHMTGGEALYRRECRSDRFSWSIHEVE